MTETCNGVIGVVGLPYCGSTILSYVLGSHSEIYCGADLYKLSPNYDFGCSLHGEECHIWTRENKNSVYDSLAISQSKYYDRICEITSSSVICDASKSPAYFNSRIPKVDSQVLLVNLNKHPLRHICSLLFNHHFVKDLGIRGDQEIKQYLSENWDDAALFINKSLKRISNHIEDVKSLENSLPSCNWREMKYEDFVMDPRGSISEVLENLGLKFEEGQLQFEMHDLHPIVGNTGPRRKVKVPKSPMKSESDLRASFYDSGGSSIQMDDKYLLVFNENQISKIRSFPHYQQLCSELGYPIDP